jgi:hypothetical protein
MYANCLLTKTLLTRFSLSVAAAAICCFLGSLSFLSVSVSLFLSNSLSLDLYLPSSMSPLFSRSSAPRTYTCVHVLVFNTLDIRTPLFVYLVYLAPLFYHLLSILAFSKHIYYVIITISSMNPIGFILK